jgi:hypothetical protein
MAAIPEAERRCEESLAVEAAAAAVVGVVEAEAGFESDGLADAVEATCAEWTAEVVVEREVAVETRNGALVAHLVVAGEER